MSGPKHLWSGDWQREFEAAAAARARGTANTPKSTPAEPAPPAPPRPQPAPAPTPRAASAPVPSRPRRRLRPSVTPTPTLVVAVVIVLAAAAFGLSTLLGSGDNRVLSTGLASSAPGQPAVANPPGGGGAAARPVNWLGMQIATQPPGAAVVQTVAIGTAADRAGINPGDVILAVNGRSIHGAQEIAGALSGLARGDHVAVQIGYGSGFSDINIPLGAPPSVQP